jgi:hypothetical protein
MANNYTELSSWLPIPPDKVDLAHDVILKACELLEEHEDYGYCCVEVDIENDGHKCGVWFHTDESAVPEHVEFIARKLVDILEIEEPFVCSWSYACDKPLIDEFGGGAFVLQRGKETYWCDAMSTVLNHAREWFKNP